MLDDSHKIVNISDERELNILHEHLRMRRLLDAAFITLNQKRNRMTIQSNYQHVMYLSSNTDKLQIFRNERPVKTVDF